MENHVQLNKIWVVILDKLCKNQIDRNSRRDTQFWRKKKPNGSSEVSQEGLVPAWL